MYREPIQEIVKVSLEVGLDDCSLKVRGIWVELISYFIKDGTAFLAYGRTAPSVDILYLGEFPGLPKFLNVVIENGDSLEEGMKAFQQLLNDGNLGHLAYANTC